MSESEAIKQRRAKYDRIERTPDALGRVIGVRRLKPSQQITIQEMSAGLDGTTPVLDEDPKSETYGKTVEVSKRVPLLIAAAVVEIDGSPVTFPKSRAELNAVIDALDEEGMAAAGKGLSQFAIEDARQVEGREDIAKN